MPLHIPTLGERVTEADIWAYAERQLTKGLAKEEDSGTLTADGTEQELVNKESAEPFMSQLILDVANMTGTDQILITETMKVLAGGGLEQFTRTHITGSQEEPILIFTPKYAVRQYRVTFQQLAGAYKDFDWSLIVEE